MRPGVLVDVRLGVVVGVRLGGLDGVRLGVRDDVDVGSGPFNNVGDSVSAMVESVARSGPEGVDGASINPGSVTPISCVLVTSAAISSSIASERFVGSAISFCPSKILRIMLPTMTAKTNAPIPKPA